MGPQDTKPPAEDDENSLEQSSTVVESGTTTSENEAESSEPAETPPDKSSKSASTNPKVKRHIWQRLNIYLLGMVLLMVLASGAVAVAVIRNQTSKQKATSLSAQNLTPDQLSKLANNSSTIGSSNQVLNIGSSAIFAGQVLAKQTLAVAQSANIGGSVTAAGVTISGTSILGQAQASQLTVSGTSTMQGALVVGQGLTVNGAANFGGSVNINQLTVQSVQFNGSVNIKHLGGSGTSPSHSTGSNLGSGGTASISGSDLTGTININTGSSPSAGCFITVTFSQAFQTVPHVIVSPVESGAAGLQYYVTRTSTNFSLCVASTPPSNQSFGFDYIALD